MKPTSAEWIEKPAFARHALIRVRIAREEDVVLARRRARQTAELVGFQNQDQTRFATAVSELARNIFQYAGSGSVEFAIDLAEQPQELLARASDHGPGIAPDDLDAILTGQFVSKTGLGAGVLGSKRLMDRFEIVSKAGEGTCILLGKCLPPRRGRIGAAEFARFALELTRFDVSDSQSEDRLQNRELLATLDELGQRQEELAGVNRELAETNRGVLALYAELDEKAASLQRANEVKTAFLSNMTHEYRTPLSSIISLTRILLDRVDGELTVEQEKQIVYIRKSSEMLLELVNDLLDIAKVESGKATFSIADFEASDLLGGLRGVFRPLMGANSAVELIIEVDPELKPLRSDETKLAQILRNLISNAIKFTERGAIRIRADCAPDDRVMFSVADSGIGLLPEHHELIFQEFAQVGSRLQKMNKGTGLGLPLSRKLARLLGGDLCVESEAGKGSTFRACVPRVFADPSERAAFDVVGASGVGPSPAPPERGSARFCILLIDDDESSRYALKARLNAEITADFAEAGDGAEGIAAMERLLPDVVFLDLAMPNVDGYDVLARAQMNPVLQGIPIIVHTSRSLTEPDRALLAHASAILSTHLAGGLLRRPSPRIGGFGAGVPAPGPRRRGL